MALAGTLGRPAIPLGCVIWPEEREVRAPQRRLAGVALLALAVVGCSTVAPPLTPTPSQSVPNNTTQASPTTSPTPTPTATPPTMTVTSADGRVSVEVPVDDPVALEVQIVALTTAEAPPELVDAGVPQACYQLLPAEAVFAVAVRISQTFARDVFGATAATVRPFFQVLRAPDGEWEWLADAEISYTAEAIVVSGTTDHFSTVCIFTDRTDLAIEPAAPRSDRVGTPFTRTLTLRPAEQRSEPITILNVDTAFTGPISVGAAQPVLDGGGYSQQWQCTAVGEYVALHSIDITNFGADNLFFTSTLGIAEPLDATINMRHDGACVTELPSLAVERVCIEVVHEQLDDFVSLLDLLLTLLGPPTDVDYLEVVIEGANDDRPARLLLKADGEWAGQLGLRGAGAKSLVSVIAHRIDGSTVDLTDTVADLIGGREFSVRVPAEDTFGECE
jgi:hypothetical protein